jgi:hypothetical protein
MPRRWALDQESPFEHVRVLDPAADLMSWSAPAPASAKSFRRFATSPSRIAGRHDRCDAGYDPVISALDSLPGFFIATGFSGHGFGIGPSAGRLVADMVTGGPTIVDPAPFRLSRFTDGSNPRPHPLASRPGRARPTTRGYPDAASFWRSCASSASTRPPLRWITEANSSRCVTFMLTPLT